MKKFVLIIVLLIAITMFSVACTDNKQSDINIDVDYNSNLTIDNITKHNMEITYTLLPAEAYSANNISKDTIVRIFLPQQY